MTALATQFAAEGDSTGLQLWRVSNAWQAAQRLALKPFGITHVQFVLLAALTWLGEPVTQQALAAYARTDPMMTSQVLRTLAASGLVDRVRHPTDRRARNVTATGAGRELANRAVVAVEACDRAFFASLGEDRAAFTAMLGRLQG
ncbi:MAG: putative MarR family transcriptional regulator [Microbacteriaceae bacterium]|jgi:DNA-binding MarR family transcriptional regulator|nr:putative MarR family transcriptional regulator [Microbacteriaceae bacterium]